MSSPERDTQIEKAVSIDEIQAAAETLVRANLHIPGWLSDEAARRRAQALVRDMPCFGSESLYDAETAVRAISRAIVGDYEPQPLKKEKEKSSLNLLLLG